MAGLGATIGRERAVKVGLKARGLVEDFIEDKRDQPEGVVRSGDA